MPPRKKSTGRPVAVSEPSDDQEALPHSDHAQSSLAAPSVSGMQSSSISGTNGRVLEDMSCTLDAKCAVCTGSATCDDGLARTSMECGVCGQKGCGQLALHDPRCTSFELRHLALHALWHVCEVLRCPGSAVSLGNYNIDAACGELAKVVMHLLNALNMNALQQEHLPYITPFDVTVGLGSPRVSTHGDWLLSLSTAARVLENSSNAVRPASLAALFGHASRFVVQMKADCSGKVRFPD